MKTKHVGVAIAALWVSACAHSYPDLASFANPELRLSTEELGAVLQEAEALQGTYSDGYKASAKWQDISQLPIIGGAAAAALVLLNNGSGAPKTAGTIGIGTIAYSNARDQLTGKGMPEAYIKGHGAMTCVLAEGSMFHGKKAKERYGLLDTYLQDLATDLEVLTELRYTEPSDVGNLAELLKTARMLADQAIAGARTAEIASLSQKAAYDNAPPAFRKAVSSVSVSVASKGRTRIPIDFATLKNDMAAPKPPNVPAAAGDSLGLTEIERAHAAQYAFYHEALGSDDAQLIIDAIAKYSHKLAGTTARLSAATPNYAKSITTNLDDCVKQAQ